MIIQTYLSLCFVGLHERDSKQAFCRFYMRNSTVLFVKCDMETRSLSTGHSSGFIKFHAKPILYMAPKQLGEILQQQQEPFTLQLYMLEKGYKDSNATSIKKNKKMLAIPKPFRSIVSKLASVNPIIKNPDAKIQDFGIWKSIKGTRREHKRKRSSSASSTTTVSRSCSSDILEIKSLSKQRNIPIKGEVPTDKILQSLTYDEGNKQQNPISVLEVVVLTSETSPVESRKNPNEIITVSDHSSQYNKIKMALQQIRQLLFDCMKDIETQVMSKKKVVITNQSQFREIAESDNLGKVIRENICTWSRQQTKSTQTLLTLDKWSSLEEQKKEITIEVADFILQDMTNFIVQQMT